MNFLLFLLFVKVFIKQILNTCFYGILKAYIRNLAQNFLLSAENARVRYIPGQLIYIIETLVNLLSAKKML